MAKCGIFNKWTDDEKGLMKEWIKENPDVRVRCTKVQRGLAELLPGRTDNAIYQEWRRQHIEAGMRTPRIGDNRKPSITINKQERLDKLPVQPYSVGKIDFMREMNSYINTLVQSQVSIHVATIKRQEAEIARLKAENTTNKEWLRKMTRIREAVQEFHV